MALLILLVSIFVGLSYHLVLGQDIEDFTQPVNVQEDPTVEKRLAEIKPINTLFITITRCDVTSNPRGPFNVQDKGTSTYYVYYNAASDLKYKTTSFYQLTIVCTFSNTASSNPHSLFVYIQPNLPPKIVNYRSDSVTLNAKTFQFSTATAYTLTVTDPETDPITITLTNQYPNMGLFTLDSGDSTKVKVTRDLRCVTEPSFVLTFTVSDGKNAVDDFRLTVTIDNLNSFPYIRNLPHAVYIPENAPGGTTLITLFVDDSDPTTTTCNTNPAADNSKFQYNSGSNTITMTGSNLDYETKDTYTISCVVNDGCKSSDSSDKLTIYVQNVIEGVEFNSNDYSCLLAEGGTRENYCTLPLTVTDRDNFPIASLEFEPSADSDKFFYDKNTKRVYLNDPYDVDNNLIPTSVDLIIKVVDTGGSTATANVHVTITDSNDNTCHFSKDVSYTIVDQSAALGIIDNFLITDGDLSSPNKDAGINIDSSSPRDSGNYVSVSSQGDVSYIKNLPTSRSGTSCVMIINCKDKGSPSRTAFATVIVSYIEITTTTVSTVSTTVTEKTVEVDLWDYSWFVAVFSLLMLCLFAGLVTAVAFIVYRCCCLQKPDRTVGSPRNKIRPITPDDKSVKRSYSAFNDDDGDDLFSTSFRSGYNNQHQWGSPRQIPALEYK